MVYSMEKSFIFDSGCRTSLKFHPDKNEVLYVQHGEILAEIADERHFS